MKKLAFFLALFTCIGLRFTIAQNVQITGTVKSAEDGQPLPGAVVMLKGTNIGTTTDVNGKYILSVPADAQTLVFSFVGLQSQEVAIAGRSVIDISLEKITANIDEVIVIAYGTVKKTSYTGSASVVSADDIEKRQTSNIAKTLEGQVAGVQVTTASGQPGSAVSIRIRGIGSINASSEPLYVVDGIPYEGNLNTLNPNDIESMTIQKDAASNALYGSRAANGVVIVTLKKGSERKSGVSFEASTGVNTRAIPEYSILTSPIEYYETYWESLRNLYQSTGNLHSGHRASEDMIGKLGYNITDVDDNAIIDSTTGRFNPYAKILYQDDWEKEMFKQNSRQEYNLNYSGAKDNLSYFFSLGYLNDEGYIVNSDFKRYSGRLKMENKVKRWFRLGADVAYIHRTMNSPDFDPTSSVNMFYASRVVAPIYPIYAYDATGNRLYEKDGRDKYDYGTALARPILSMTNPLGTQNLDKNNSVNNNFNGTAFAEVTFLNDFSFQFTGNFQTFDGRNIFYYNGEYGQFMSQNGYSSLTNDRTLSYTLQQLLRYTKAFGKSNISFLAGHENTNTETNYLNASKNNFVLPGLVEMDNAILNPTASSGKTDYFIEGFLSSFDYSYGGKYFASFSYRRDGSSRFHKDHRWGDFGSAGVAWRISEESFVKPFTALSNLKVKASYGTLGNDRLPNLYPYMDQYVVRNNGGQIALDLFYKGNEKISWEKSYNFNTGVEISFFNNRISGEVNYFQRTVKDMLFNRPLPITTGIATYPDNVGDMKNTGYEFELGLIPVNNNYFRWELKMNGTHFNNKVLKLPPERRELGIVDGNFKLMEGHSRYDYFMKEYAGVDPATGNAQWWMDVKDENGVVTGREKTSTYNSATDYFLKSSIPDFYGGINNQFNIFGFDMSVLLTYQIGGTGYDGIYQTLMASGEDGQNWHTDIRNRWTPGNPNTNVPKVIEGEDYANARSSRFFIDASYLSVQNIAIGYTVPNKLFSRSGISRIRIYAVADNVALFSKRKGYDPRQNFTGSSSDFNYAPIRTISGGIQVNF